jgi:hypothetical protein
VATIGTTEAERVLGRAAKNQAFVFVTNTSLKNRLRATGYQNFVRLQMSFFKEFNKRGAYEF